MVRFKIMATGLAIMAILAGAGCKQSKEAPSSVRISGQKEIVIGLIPEQNVFRQRERYQILSKYLYARTGIHINLVSLRRYGNIIKHFNRENMDGAFFGSFTYALARSQIGVEPLARPVNPDGTTTYHGYLLARKDSRIRNAADLRGKRFAFVEKATSAGYLFPLAYFSQHGIRDIDAYFKETFFAGSHDAAILAVLNREADAGAAKNTIYDQMAAENPRIAKELTIIATFGLVPQNCLAVRKDLEPEVRAVLKQALVEMDKSPDGRHILRQFGARAFIETSDADYRYLYKLSSEAGIDLTTYQYENK